MSAHLEETYFTWLYSKTGSVRTRSQERTYWHLLKLFFTTEFVWFVPNDDNRCADGKDLRFEFLEDHEIKEVDPHWLDQGCSFLEMMIALSRRLAFLAEGEPRDWFWHLVENLDLTRCNDAYFNEDMEVVVVNAVDKVIWRQYYANGHGGLFPLKNATRDQRNVEIWYQLNAYLMERGL